MKRASFIAPLLLIAVGVLLLLRNIYPELPLGTFFGRFWPIILIGWGVLRLGELAMWKSQGRPLPVSGISGGEWIMAIVIAMFGTGFHNAQGFIGSFPGAIQIDGVDLFGDSHEFPLEASAPASATPRIIFEDFRGDVRIFGVDSPTSQVKITGQKRVRGVKGDANNITIRSTERTTNRGSRVSFSLDVSVPRGATVDFRGRAGDVTVEKITGGVTLSSNSGELKVEDVGGPVQIDLRRADVHVNVAKVPGTLSVGSGEVSANRIIGPAKMTARSYDVTARDFSGPLDIDLARGDITLEIGAGVAATSVRTRSGDIEVGLPSSAQFRLDATTARGDATNDFGDALRREENGRQGSVRGSVGNGPQITAEAGRGDVLIRRSEVRATAVTPASPATPAVPTAPKPPAPPKPLEKLEQ
jgi:Putative adhesin